MAGLSLSDALDPSQWCPHCGGRLRVTHSYSVPGGRTQDRLCDRQAKGCGSRFVDTILISRRENTGRGQGAYAQAQRLAKAAEEKTC